jgi:hypothetical protein
MADKNFKVKTGLTLPSPLPVDQGGTGQTSANNTLNALLPLQTDNSGKVLKTDGTDTSWFTIPAAYTRGVTSQRPVSPTGGDLFFNTEKKAFEVWTGSAWVSVAVNGAVPLPPTIGTVSLSGLTASVPFTGPNDFGDAAISTYTATSNPGSISVNSATSPISITGLTASTAYTFTVTATNSYGISNASSASNSVTTANVPGAPTSVTAADTGIDGEALIEWTAPGSNGGSAITDYIVEYSSNSGSSYTVFADGTSTGTSATVTGLTIGTTYIFRVKAVNAIGTGTASTATSNYIPVIQWEPVGAYEPIAVATAPLAGASSITFGSIPSIYTDLQIRGISRPSETGTSGSAYVFLIMNNDSGSNYSRHSLYGGGGGVATQTSASDTNIRAGFQMRNGYTSNFYATSIIDILDYSNVNKNKVVRSISGFTAPEGSVIAISSGAWLNTNAVTSLTLTCESGNFIQYSSLALYGIKGA